MDRIIFRNGKYVCQWKFLGIFWFDYTSGYSDYSKEFHSFRDAEEWIHSLHIARKERKKPMRVIKVFSAD